MESYPSQYRSENPQFPQGNVDFQFTSISSGSSGSRYMDRGSKTSNVSHQLEAKIVGEHDALTRIPHSVRVTHTVKEEAVVKVIDAAIQAPKAEGYGQDVVIKQHDQRTDGVQIVGSNYLTKSNSVHLHTSFRPDYRPC